jgi:hypothetical protein
MGFLSFSQKHGHSIFAGSALAEARLPAQFHETDPAEGLPLSIDYTPKLEG